MTYSHMLTGRVVWPGEPDYDEARQGFNRAIQQFPLAVNYCRNNEDVANAVLWAQSVGVPLRIRGGGHNYEGFSNGDGCLVVDVSERKGLELDEQKNLLKVGAGVTNGELYAYAGSRGYPFPGGTCPTVGVCGYATGGGWGLSCRYLGLGCDSLEELELVDFRGCTVKAGRNENADLFWACRGAGGGNFGVITSLTFRLPQKVERVTLVEVDCLHVTIAEQERFLLLWQRFLAEADPRVTLLARIYHSEHDGLAILVRGFFYGPPDEAERILRPFFCLPNAEYNLEYVPFLTATEIIGAYYPPFENFQAASRFLYEDISPRQASELAGLIQERAPGSVFAGLSLYALGGRVRDVGVDETAFFYRNAKYILWLETIWEEQGAAEVNRAWVHRRFPVLAEVSKGAYVNFPYRLLPHSLQAYYGAHAAFLQHVKEKYDPYNVFGFPQGICRQGSVLFPQARPAVPVYAEKAKRTDDAFYRRARYVRDI